MSLRAGAHLLYLLLITLSLWGKPALGNPNCIPNNLLISAAPETNKLAVKPDTGWTTITLPDLWTTRWPRHEGAVWYQLTWATNCPFEELLRTPIGVSVDGISMAGEIYINSTLLWRDRSLTEPLSMSWNMPRWWTLPAPALLAGENTIWIRTSGPATLSPGLGRVKIGLATDIQQTHTQSVWRQRLIYYITLGLSSALGCVFFAVWCLRRSERAYGWYAVMSLCWVVYLSTILALSPWPFNSTLWYSRANNISFQLYVLSFCLFTWRFTGQTLPRIERILWLCNALGILISLFAPRPLVELVWLTSALIFLATCVHCQIIAWRNPQPQHLLLAACWLIFLIVGIHDLIRLLGGWQAHQMWGAIAGLMATLVMASLLGARLVLYMQRIESFNTELEQGITLARQSLKDVLEREHAQAIRHATLRERLDIVHDLHDGLGGSLVRSMAFVEQSSVALSNERMLSLLKTLRDDLRQVIDHGSSAGANAPTSPIQWAAPLRHRFTRLFEQLNIQSTWQLDQHWKTQPSTLICLALTRLIEEALANVIKHSAARSVTIVCSQADTDSLHIRIQDDGIGFNVDSVLNAGLSVGMRSMAARAQRLGGSFNIESNSQGTLVFLSINLNTPTS